MTVRVCPRCDLRFASDSELDQHLYDDHGVDLRPPPPGTDRPRDVQPLYPPDEGDEGA